MVHSWELFRYGGPATKVNTRRSLANKPHDHAKREAVKQHLKYPPVIFTGEQARSVALGFGDAAHEGGYVILACAVLPDQAHLVVARDGRLSEQIRSHLKRAASRRLRKDGLHPLARFAPDGETPPSPWSRGGWQVYLNTVEDVLRAVRYVKENPLREGKRRQMWSFVTRLEEFLAGQRT